ncbi:MAG: phosphoadenosine phosphosulfate reductase family protein [Flavobacteriaceae bacterium]|nr:phosphoadenosine phosphosulfate reductase family protein [Flavobacteriaceae bacterium]
MQKCKVDIGFYNKVLKNKSPDDIISWALKISDNKIVSTSFGVYSEVLLSTISRHDKNIEVIWCDTLFNSQSTYDHAAYLTSKYKLNIHKYQAAKSKTEIASNFNFESINDKNFIKFSNLVKIEPFKRALRTHNPQIWFTNIRVRQTAYRNKKDILSYSKEGILKVSPFYYWNDDDLDDYIKTHNLNKNNNYFDPVKALKNRECGIHLQ